MTSATDVDSANEGWAIKVFVPSEDAWLWDAESGHEEEYTPHWQRRFVYGSRRFALGMAKAIRRDGLKATIVHVRRTETAPSTRDAKDER